MISGVSESLRDDLYQKTRDQLNLFIDETNALLAAGDALHEDRTALARERLAEFLKRSDVSASEAPEPIPPVTRALDSTREYVQANPWAAVGAAVGLGIIASVLLNRKS